MAYQALARKWRPQDFAGLIGQEPIVTALRNGLREGRIAQAYLFSGIRGIGKTTAARILAKALNCERGPAPEPCNQCPPCLEISQGSDLDVLEVDAATHSKVEQIRELTDSLRYGPARDRYKVVVLDEVHRLSRQAFDALLKIVEEPPRHLVFVFATTEIEAVPATILSRCQEYHFRRVPAHLQARHLRTLCEAEAIEATDIALRLVSRASEGSVRDAVALLDQLATYGGGRVSEDDAQRLLGTVDPALFHCLLDAILRGEGQTISELIHRVEEEGWDPRQLHARFLTYCRDALHLALGIPVQRIDLPEEEARRLASLAESAGYEDLLRAVHHLLGSESVVRRSEVPALALEIAWLRAAELPKLRRVEELLSSPSTRPSPPPAPSPSAAAPPLEAPTPPPEPDAAEAEEKEDEGIDALLQRLSRRQQSLVAHLQGAQRMIFIQGELRIYAAPGDSLLREALARQRNRVALEEALDEVWGPGTRWRILHGDRPPQSEDATDAGPEAITALPTVQAVLDIFDGSVEAVDPISRNEEE